MIPLLPKWCLTNKLPAFYDLESATAIEQTAKLYGTMQGMIDDYNKFAEDFNKQFEDYVNGLNKDHECFQASITKLVHDYIGMLDEKLKMQDKEIDEAVNYMKDNLSSSITTLVAEMKEMGELDQVILDAIDGIDERFLRIENSSTDLETRATDLETRATNLETSVNNLITKVNKTNYSTEEQIIGTWIDGKTLYRKIISCGALPNTKQITINHNITNLNQIINIYGIAISTLFEASLPLPCPHSQQTGVIEILANISSVSITTNTDRSNYEQTYITLEYTKTTD